MVLHTLLIVENLLFGPHSLLCAAERPWKLAILRVGWAEKSTLIFYQTHQYFRNVGMISLLGRHSWKLLAQATAYIKDPEPDTSTQ